MATLELDCSPAQELHRKVWAKQLARQLEQE
eukprot:SAG31_NODE_40171_length_282_cov_1.409836_1_plen_30_part_10